MAESGSGDKTEKPSQQKLRKTREQGQAARSRDLGMAVGVLLSFKLLVLLTPQYMDDFGRLFRLALAPTDLDAEAGHALFIGTLWLTGKLVLPLLVLPLAALLTGVVPGGLLFAPGNWMPKMQRLSPAANLGRLVSGKHWGDFAMTVAKAACVLMLLVHLSRNLAPEFVRLQSLSLDAALALGAGLTIDALLALAALLLIFAFIDAPLQQFLFLQGQRMTKQEVKEEYKTNEGRPEVRQRIRALQRQLARRSARAAVPEADVVVVNPEHYAVALRYDTHQAEAPFVVAKGVDEMALYIRELAVEHGVQVLGLPPLARALYNSSQVQQQIPASLYQAVAQVLGYVMQLKAFRAGQRRHEPDWPDRLDVPAHLSDPTP
ncbi:MAG TPA: flagellar type III secretion system protein FlhB [Roseateles sp.]